MEIQDLAVEFSKKEKGLCQEAAIDYLSMNINPKITQDVYTTYVKALEKLGEVRRGFYCILCDAQTQAKLRDFWASTNIFYKDRIYFSKEFCRKLVDNTIRSSFFTSFYLKRYTEDMAMLIGCKKGNPVEKEYEISFWVQQQVKNCYYFKDKYFFFFCERYCDKFHIAKPNGILDGDLNELKKFYDIIKENRHQVFNRPSNNLLMNFGLTYEESLLEENFESVFRDNIFFTPLVKRVRLDEFKTDIVYWGGMNPWDSCENSTYELILAKAFLYQGFIAALIWTLFV